MDKQPLNTGEQKDMTEFFTNLITKLEEMGPELVRTPYQLFSLPDLVTAYSQTVLVNV